MPMPSNIQVWDNKYNTHMSVLDSSDGITGNFGSRFFAKGGKGYSYEEILKNELLEHDAYLPDETFSRCGNRFIIQPIS